MSKRLLLCKVKELYDFYIFQRKKFSMLAYPEWCNCIGLKSIHSVCVIIIHDNLKFNVMSVSVTQLTEYLAKCQGQKNTFIYWLITVKVLQKVESNN